MFVVSRKTVGSFPRQPSVFGTVLPPPPSPLLLCLCPHPHPRAQTYTHTHRSGLSDDLFAYVVDRASQVAPPAHFAPHPAECLTQTLLSRRLDYQQPLSTEITPRRGEKRAEFLFNQLPVLLNCAPPLLIIYMLQSPPPTCHSSASILPIHTVSIPVCKGHPGNREAAVDREINKQKKREASNAGQSRVIHRVKCRPTSQEHTPTDPGLMGVRPLPSLFFLSILSCISC